MKRILIINKYFYPGYRAGGPIQSLKNMSDALQNNFDIGVLTCDRDYLDVTNYKSVVSGDWNNIENYQVFYALNGKITINLINKIYKDFKPDLIYLNSFFDILSIKSIIVAKLFNIPIVLAPRGEFSPGALNIKKSKKNIFFIFSKIIRLYKNIIFHATNQYEYDDIINILPNANIFISENFVKKPIIIEKYNNLDNTINIVYISRITRKKNLLFFLDFLQDLQIDRNIILDIYGPIEDKDYWSECQNIINKINKTKTKIKINYKNSVSPNNFKEIYKNIHFSILPTFGENFGHSIYESLAHGVPVIISNKTPWRQLEANFSGFDLELNTEEFKKVFLKIDNLSSLEYKKLQKGAFKMSIDYYNSSSKKVLINNFLKVIK